MIDVEVEDPAWTKAMPDAEALATEAATAALKFRRRGGAERANAVVLLTDDATVRDLNAGFRGRDAATNVLSFPAPASAAPHLGDVALALGICAAEARAQGKPLADHLRHLVAHGVLHLLGWDHQDEAEAEAMEATERAILAALGVPDPYRAPEPGPDGAHV